MDRKNYSESFNQYEVNNFSNIGNDVKLEVSRNKINDLFIFIDLFIFTTIVVAYTIWLEKAKIFLQKIDNRLYAVFWVLFISLW